MLRVRHFENRTANSGKRTPEITLLDGIRVTVRPVQQSDLGLIQEMHQRLSKDSIYYRYLAPRAPDLQELERLCFLGSESGEAIVATIQAPEEKVIALACYMVHPHDSSTAEPGIVVEDGYQAHGLGRRMFLALCEHAAKRGLARFECFTHLANQRVMRLIKGCGLRYETAYSQGMRDIRVWLRSDATSVHCN